jgi:CubicO group peptidase (beta-lactamase class C family)
MNPIPQTSRSRRTSLALLSSMLLLAVSSLPATAQTALRIGESVSGSLESDSRNTYSFEAEAGYYVFGHVNQISVDVVVRVLGPDGDKIGEFDSPARGPENFQISTETAGTYVIEVTPFEHAEGDYEVLLKVLEPKATDPEALVDQLMTPFSGPDVPGAVISVLREGEIVFAKGYGMSNLTYGIPMDQDTGMSVASVSKQFTGMAIMLLVLDDSLSLGDDVREYIPELKDFGPTVTIQNMLNHMTGYREILNFLPMGGWQSTDAMTRDEPIRVVQRQAALQTPPGSAYNYNNTSFMLLATVVERVSGETWQDYLERRIFRPLGMDHTTVKTRQGQVIPGSSQGYTSGPDGGFQYVTDFASAYGASGVNTTAIDITKWMLNYSSGLVGGPEAIDALTTPGITTAGDTTSYGLGLGIGTYRGQRVFRHTGGETSHRTWFSYMPDIRSGLFISSNNPSFSLAMQADITDAFFADFFEPVKEPEPEVTSADSPSAEQLEAIAGAWMISGALRIEYTVEDGKLFAQATNQPKFELSPTSDSTFSFVGVPAAVTFHWESDGTVSRATHHQGPDSPMERSVEEDWDEERLAEYTGRYYSEELETFYTLRLDEGKLHASSRRVESFPVNHVTEETFAGAWFFAQMEFYRDPVGHISGFTVGNGRTTGVWFQRTD